jgi:transposase-like protein
MTNNQAPITREAVWSWNKLTLMMRKMGVVRAAIRYSEAFKREVVWELEREELTLAAVMRKYGIRGDGTVQNWVRQYGNGTRGKVIRVEKPEEINELQRLKERVRRLESALADANIDLALERAYTRMACERAGIQDVEAFKKKADGKRRMKP